MYAEELYFNFLCGTELFLVFFKKNTISKARLLSTITLKEVVRSLRGGSFTSFCSKLFNCFNFLFVKVYRL